MSEERQDPTTRDPQPDRRAASHLRQTYGPGLAVTEFERDALHSRIVARASDRLADLAAGRVEWWSPLARWTRPALPIGLGACLVLALALLRFPPPQPTTLSSVVRVTEEKANATTDPITEYLDATASTDPAATLLTASDRAAFLTAVLEYPLDASGGQPQ